MMMTMMMAMMRKRNQKEAATDESGTSVRSMMTGVKIYDAEYDYDDGGDDYDDDESLVVQIILI